MKRVICLLVIGFLFLSIAITSAATSKEYRERYVVVKVKADGKKDVSDEIQKIIDSNPNRTLFFPDGVYLISKPICTPADPKKSVALELSNFAVIKAQAGWTHDEAMIRLGGKDPFNNITPPGSNYYLQGGVIDGSGVAKGVSIDSGRETSIRNTSIKNVSLGLHVKHGANSGSSDADIFNVNITGNNRSDCIGVLVEGYDNTFTNMRIGGVHTGFILRSSANSLRNIHPLYSLASGWDHYTDSIAFCDLSWENWYDFCYSDQYCTGFYFADNVRSICHNCFCFWWKTLEGGEIGFRAGGKFNSLLSNCKVTLRGDAKDTNFLVGAEGGYGVIENPFFNEDQAPDKCYQNYLVGKVLHP